MAARGIGVAIATALLLAGTSLGSPPAAAAPQASAAVVDPGAPPSGPSLSATPESRSVRDTLGVPPAPGAELRPEPAALPDVAARPPSSQREEARRFGFARPGELDPFDSGTLPGRLADPSLRPLWSAGLEAEREERLLESSQHYEEIVARVPEESYTYWRIARNYWRAGEGLPTEDKVGRLEYFDLAESWAGRGIEIDPDCAACMLWKFVSIGRQATTRGILTAMGDAREMDRLLTRGIELQPGDRDGPGNTTLGNLYYAGAVFYRVVPEWWWLRLLVGVRGDKERSLEYARRAVAISQARIDYRVELGAVLLCLGSVRRDAGLLEEGRQVLEGARALDDYLSTDSLDKSHAVTLMASPAQACGYSRDGFIDVNALKDEARARR